MLQALTRLFGFDHSLRRVRRSDFHVPAGGTVEEGSLWIEADFDFPELKKPKSKSAAVPSHFAHMSLKVKGGVPTVRYRLEAQLNSDGEVDDWLYYVLETDNENAPSKKSEVPKAQRNCIHVHYLPARRDPLDHISFSAGSLLGRALRATNWQTESEQVVTLTKAITEALAGNEAVVEISSQLSTQWSSLHKSDFYKEPSVSFERDDIHELLRHLTIAFSPGHEEPIVEFSRLSDGQKSLLYLSLVLALQNIGRRVLGGELPDWDREKLRPAVFTMIAMEEPENSLSPHYLGRVVSALSKFAAEDDAQSILATHSPSLLRRAEPKSIRYLRLNTNRRTAVKTILMPAESDEAYKFIREAVQAYPELYFSRLVILGEGDSEEIVLPRLLRARGLTDDATSIAVVPLGGRHVNHFWRLLHALEIPHVTLLDLDLGRFQGGWGRIKYAAEQLASFLGSKSPLAVSEIAKLPKWNSSEHVFSSESGKHWLEKLEASGIFFSAPLDLDFVMLLKAPNAYGVTETERQAPDQETVVSVLGKKHHGVEQYIAAHQSLFGPYHERFKLGSKPAAHLGALASLSDEDLKTKTPVRISRLIDSVEKMLSELPE